MRFHSYLVRGKCDITLQCVVLVTGNVSYKLCGVIIGFSLSAKQDIFFLYKLDIRLKTI